VNNDGRPDPGATVDYCKETGYVPPERPQDKAPASPTFDTKTSLPTELENKAAGDSSGSAPATSSSAPAAAPPAQASDKKGRGK
jgi:hypothetical protein